MEAEVVPVLHVADAAAAIAWYGRLGFTEQWVHRFGPGMPAFVSLLSLSAALGMSAATVSGRSARRVGSSGSVGAVRVLRWATCSGRRRVQHAVDRRFNRARYDAQIIVAAFTARLRRSADFDTVQGDLVSAVH